MTAPPPLTPPECDLRDFRFMPLDVVRFTQSDLVSTADPEAVVAAIRLWAASWHQVPAGSLTDDDRTLSQLAGYGRAVAAWHAVKAEALRGFIKCSDGRLYHPVVAEKARDAFKGKLQQRHRTFAAAIRKHNERNPGDRRTSPSFEEWLHVGRPTEVTRDSTRPEVRQDELDLGAGTELEPVHARTPAPARTGAETVPTGNSRDKGGSSRVTGENVTRDTGGSSRSSHAENRSKGEGQGEGEGEGDSIGLVESPQAPLAAELAAELADLGAVRLGSDAAHDTAAREVEAWLEAGILPDTMRDAVRAFTAKARSPSRSLHRFDDHVRLLHTQRGKPQTPRKRGGPATVTKAVGPDDDDPRIADLRANLRKRCGPRTYDGWIAPAQFTLNGTGLVATLPSPFMRDWLNDHFSRELAEEAAALDLGQVRLTNP